MRLRKIIPFTVLILSALFAQVFAVAFSQPQSNSYSQPSKKTTKPSITKVSQTLASKDIVLSGEAKSQDLEKLNPAPQSGSELIFKIGEEQIIFLQDFLKLSARDFSMDDLQKFRGVINAAVEDHPEVLASVAARRSAGFSVREAKAAYYPQVNAQTQRGPVKSDPSTTLGTAARNYQAASVGLVVRQLLFDFGGTNNAIDASNARDELSQYKTRLTRSDVALRAVQAHHEMLRATRQLDLANRNFQSRKSILDLVSQRQDLGGGTISDVVRAQSRVADAAASVVAAMQKIGLVEASYRELFGPSKSQDSSVLSILVDIPLDKALLEEVKLSSSDSYKVKMAIATRNAAEFDLKSLVGKNLPSISVEVSNTRRDLAGPGEPGHDRSIYFVAKQNLYTGGADTAREQQYREKFLQSEEDLRAAKREAERVYDQALLEANSVESLVKSRLRAVELSAESLRMVREQFAYRRGSLLDLLTAQEALNTAGRDLIDAQIDSAQTKYKVLSAAALLNKFFALE